MLAISAADVIMTCVLAYDETWRVNQWWESSHLTLSGHTIASTALYLVVMHGKGRMLISTCTEYRQGELYYVRGVKHTI